MKLSDGESIWIRKLWQCRLNSLKMKFFSKMCADNLRRSFAFYPNDLQLNWFRPFNLYWKGVDVFHQISMQVPIRFESIVQRFHSFVEGFSHKSNNFSQKTNAKLDAWLKLMLLALHECYFFAHEVLVGIQTWSSFKFREKWQVDRTNRFG